MTSFPHFPSSIFDSDSRLRNPGERFSNYMNETFFKISKSYYNQSDHIDHSGERTSEDSLASSAMNTAFTGIPHVDENHFHPNFDVG